jgi:hypothetical protein
MILVLLTTTIHPSTQLIAILVGIVLPLVTGVVTKLGAGSAVKAVANAVLAVVTGVLVSLASEPEKGLALYDTLYAIALAAVSSWASYAGLWKPTGTAGALQQGTANFGIGKAA